MYLDEVVEEYLMRCARICNKRGFYSLYLSKGDIRELLIDKFGKKNSKVSDLIKICEKEVFSYIEEKKFCGWSLVNENEIKNKIKNIVHQQDLL